MRALTFDLEAALRFIIISFLFLYSTNAFAEPTFDELLKRSLITLELDGSVDKWTKRARLSSLIPDIVFDGSRKDDSTLGSREKSNFFRDEKGDLLHEWTQAQVDKDQGSNLNFSVRVQWKLGALIFHPDELASESRSAKKREQKLRFIEKLASSFATWKSLSQAKQKGHLREGDAIILMSLEHYFNGLSGGWFSKEKESSK